jgi:formylglycine-generating enzyme required for sulfatase activity
MSTDSSSRFFLGGLTAACFCACGLGLGVQSEGAVAIDWVTVGDPGNAADTTGYGAVADSFQIMKFEWTNSKYVQFLNAVDASGTNPNAVYSTNMGSDPRGGITFTSGASDGSKYAVKTNMGDKPVNFVSWFDAARVANWLQNGQGSGSTETGAYTLTSGTSGTAPAVNSGATFYVPTENQWYKAAFYKGSGTSAGYWDYSTGSDTAPTAVSADGAGVGSAGNTGNFANFSNGAVWNGQTGNLTTVGTNGGPSPYDTFDMSGNVSEWNDLTGAVGSSRGRRGGGWNANALNLSSSGSSTLDPSSEFVVVGFRLASPAAVPEPSTCAMALAGLACGGWSMFRRRTS